VPIQNRLLWTMTIKIEIWQAKQKYWKQDESRNFRHDPKTDANSAVVRGRSIVSLESAESVSATSPIRDSFPAWKKQVGNPAYERESAFPAVPVDPMSTGKSGNLRFLLSWILNRQEKNLTVPDTASLTITRICFLLYCKRGQSAVFVVFFYCKAARNAKNIFKPFQV